jgi:hypothetical protein
MIINMTEFKEEIVIGYKNVAEFPDCTMYEIYINGELNDDALHMDFNKVTNKYCVAMDGPWLTPKGIDIELTYNHKDTKEEMEYELKQDYECYLNHVFIRPTNIRVEEML